VLVQPDLPWYTGISEKKGITPRCPYATVERCPRFYQSVSLLGDVRIATKITPSEDKRLLDAWSKTDVWPKVMEQETSVSGSDGRHSLFSNFCPEVSFETFGLFAVSLSRFADEIDRDQRHRALSMSGTAHGYDWRWNWEHVREQHYTECPLYSVLHARPILLGEAAPQRANHVSDKMPLSDIPQPQKDPWYKRPIGVIGIGLFITVVGALFVAWLRQWMQ
jgi:hypothetical protein